MVHWLNPDETVTYLANTVRWDRTPLRMPAMPFFLNSHLTSGDFLPGHTPQLGHVIPDSDPPRLERYGCPIAVKTWPDTLGYTIPTALQDLPFPYRFTVRWIALDKIDGEAVLRDYQSKWEQLIWDGWAILRGLFPSDAAQQADSITTTLIDVQDDRASIGYSRPSSPSGGTRWTSWPSASVRCSNCSKGKGSCVCPKSSTRRKRCKAPGQGTIITACRSIRSRRWRWRFCCPMARSGAGRSVMSISTMWPCSPRQAMAHRFEPCSIRAGRRFVEFPGNGSDTPGQNGEVWLCRHAVFALSQRPGLHLRYRLPALLHDDAGGRRLHYDLGTSTSAGFHVLGRVDDGEDEQRWCQGWLEDLFVAQGLPATADEKREIWKALGRFARKYPAPCALSAPF